MIVMAEGFLTVKEVAQKLRISEETVKRMLRRQEIPGYRIGVAWRVDAEDFERYLESRKNTQDKK